MNILEPVWSCLCVESHTQLPGSSVPRVSGPLPEDAGKPPVASPVRKRESKKASHGRLPLPWLGLAAVQCGVLAGFIALIYIMLDGVVRGDGLWTFPNLLSATFYSPRALSPAFTAETVIGMALHILVSGMSGLIFAALLTRYLARPMRAHWLGALFGIAWYYLTFRYFWSSVNPAVVLYQPFPGTLLGHMVFGFCMGLYPSFVRELETLRETVRAGEPERSWKP